MKRFKIALQLIGAWIGDKQLRATDKWYFVLSLPGMVVGRVWLFGALFRSDSRLGLLLLPDYLNSSRFFVEHCIRRSGDLHLVDVGGNIGQFSIFALQGGITSAEVYEPNPEAFEYLSKNLRNYDNVFAYNYGISQTANQFDLFYVKNKSGQGSLHEANATRNLRSTKLTKIPIFCQPLSGPQHNPESKAILVKIDVEGSELEVLKGLNFDFQYLLVEISPFRSGGFSESVLLDAVFTHTNKSPTILLSDRLSENQETWNALIHLESND